MVMFYLKRFIITAKVKKEKAKEREDKTKAKLQEINI